MSLYASARPAAEITAFDFRFPALDGGRLSLSEYAGQPLLIVNTASQCGFTPQYDGLQRLYERYRAQGLVVIGLPSNDFGRQETGTADDIKTFCDLHFKVTFPMSDKITIKGDEAHDFYLWARGQVAFAGRPRWNFHKIIIDRSGNAIAGYTALTKPSSNSFQKRLSNIISQ